MLSQDVTLPVSVSNNISANGSSQAVVMCLIRIRNLVSRLTSHQIDSLASNQTDNPVNLVSPVIAPDNLGKEQANANGSNQAMVMCLIQIRNLGSCPVSHQTDNPVNQVSPVIAPDNLGKDQANANGSNQAMVMCLIQIRNLVSHPVSPVS